jgi:hypothetical protein
VQFASNRAFVQRLNIFQSMFEPISAQIDLILRHRVKHERVIRIRGMTQGKDFSVLLVHLRFLRHLSVDFRHRAREIWRTKLCDALTNSERVREQASQKIAQFQSLTEFVPPSKKQNSRRDFTRRLLETSLCLFDQ